MAEITPQNLLAIVDNLSAQQRSKLAEKIAALKPDSHFTATPKLVACVTTKDQQYPNLDSLRDYLKSKLPAYFVPQTFIPVEKLPRTPIGKIERKDLQTYPWIHIDEPTSEAEPLDDGEDFFASSMDYAAPSSDYEKLLAGIWCDVLGIEDISVHDNFVEVGGDSLLSIRILARINKAGLSIAPEDFFEFPTISQQAMCLENVQANSVEQGVPEGTFNLIPIQHWFFARIKHAPEHWNHNCLLSTNQSLDYVSLERTIQKIMLQHDVLRSVFSDVDGVIKQHIAPFNGSIPLKFIDLSRFNNDNELLSKINTEAMLLNSSFKLETGPLIQFLFVKTSEGDNNKLLVTVHHLLVDAQSWHLLLEDLSNCWQAMSTNVDFKLSPKSTSFKLWSEKLHQYADSIELKSELDYWQQQSDLKLKKLPLDFENLPGQNIEQTATTVTLNSQLDIDMLTAFCHNNKTDVQTVLVAALVNTLATYSDTDSVLLDVEGHGRESLFEKIDISRTLGWFTSVFPVVFNTAERSLDSNYFHSIKSTISAIPKKGIGHGVLREIAKIDALNHSPLAEVCFNYLGKVNNVIGDKSSQVMLTREAMNIAQPRSPIASRAFVFEVNCAVIDDKLTVKWSFSSKLHLTETVEQLANNQIMNIEKIIDLDIIVNQSADNDEIFDLADMDDSDLDTISDLLDNLDND